MGVVKYTGPVASFHCPTNAEIRSLGQNNVWSNADYVEVEYDLHETQSLLQRKAFIIANQPHIVKPAAATLQNFITDLAAPLKECKVHFSPVQEGTGDPSPDNVRAISGWTGLTAYRGEENLIPANLNWLPQKMKTTNRTITASVYNCFWFPVPKGTIYFHKRNSSVGIAYMAFIDKEPEIGDVVYGNITLSSYTNYTFDNSEGHPYAIICGPTGTRTETASEYCLQNEICVTAAHFNSLRKYPEPYSGTTLPIDWTTEAGTVYGGYVDLVSGEVWKDWDYYTVDGSQNIGCEGGYMFYMNSPWLSNLGCVNSYDYTELIMANNFQTITKHSDLKSYNGEYLITGYASNSGGNWIYFKLTNDISGTNNTSTVKSYFAEHPLTVYFKLKTPTLITTLTPTALKTLRGTNNIWASNGGDNIEIAYWSH